MLKILFVLILALVLFDQIFQHGVGTAAAMGMVYHAYMGITQSVQDSIFSH
jgi:hypothetical protein